MPANKNFRSLLGAAVVAVVMICLFTGCKEEGGTQCMLSGKHLMECFLTILPVLLFLLACRSILKRLKAEGYKISDALKEDPAGAGNSDTASPPASPPTSGGATQSASRLIAFLTAVVTLILVVCLTSFWIYQSLQNNVVDLSKLSTVFLSLGLGVIPYSVNKLTTAFKQPSDNS